MKGIEWGKLGKCKSGKNYKMKYKNNEKTNLLTLAHE